MAQNALTEIIRHEITERGIVSFARFMELALYCPKHGYYEAKKDNPGRRGDFYTSVGVGEIFGQLLARQFAGWLDAFNPSSPTVHLLEAGAHDGRLAGDILAWLRQHRSDLFGRIEYWILEPSAVRQAWQQEALQGFRPRVRWLSHFTPPPAQRFRGIFFSNELLDAMPVHRYGWEAANRRWHEWGVGVDGDKFTWVKMPDTEYRMPVAGLEPVLPDGYVAEACPAAERWWREAAGVLECGKLMTIDYGLAADELYTPQRLRGTLRAYFRHQVSDDLLANAGGQDLTAHVNFSALQAAGEAAGLKTESFTTQSQFLTQILAAAAKDNSLGQWGSAETRQFQTLTHPEHLGRAFRVLVQAR